MCIKIIGAEKQEFDPRMPLEQQIAGAHEVVINYDPTDSKIDSFVEEMLRMYKSGISCNVDIKVNPNNCLDGLKLERKIGKLKGGFETNEFIKQLTKMHADADRRLEEIAGMCLEKSNEH